ncbi:hypothetical protein GCM10009736_30260 [Actinomadura bangladeshensis]
MRRPQQQLAGLRVLGGVAVVGDVPGDEDGVERQRAEMLHDPRHAVGPVVALIEVGVAELRENNHDRESRPGPDQD